MDAVQRRVLELVTNRYRAESGFQPEREITMETSIRDELAFDSIMLVVLQIEVEDAFHIRFDPAQEDFLTIFSNVRELCAAVRRHMGTEI